VGCMVLLVKTSGQRIRHLAKRIELSAKSRWGRFWMSIAATATAGWVIKIDAIEELNLRESGVLPSRRNRELVGLRKNWYLSEELQRVGKYHEAVRNREEILSQLYEYQGINSQSYYPPFLGAQWSSNFGHLTAIGHLQLAQSLEFVTNGLRFVLANPKPANHELFKAMTCQMQVVRQVNGTNWSELPEFWHVAERIRTIRGKHGFIDGVKLFDDIFAPENLETLKRNFFKLDEDYINNSSDKLQKIGLPKNSPFVTLHVRESFSQLDPRTQPRETYFRSVEELNKKGIWVVRIGDSGMEKFPQFPRFIDLVQQPDAGREFHAYLLSHCEFFVGTASGPSWVPRLFGKPSLITNINEIGTQMSRGPGATIYLPKRFINRNGRPLSMREVFQMRFGFASLDKEELKNKGFALEHNSESEISSAVNEILETYRDFSPRSSETHPNIQLLRSEFQAVANGNFAQSYIEQNQEFFK